MTHRKKINQFRENAFPISSGSSNLSDSQKIVVESTKTEVKTDLDNWQSYYEFIACCIAKHSIPVEYLHFQHLNFVQDFIVYMLVGIPVCYMQMVLGQYSSTGIFLIRKMLPIAEGISYVYFFTIFTITIIIVTEIETNLIYFILAIYPANAAWNSCPTQFADICWDFSKKCTHADPCVNATIHLPTYIFWNYTYLGGAYPMHEAKIVAPNTRLIGMTLLSWLAIYFLTIMSFHKIKKSIKILVAILFVLKLTFILKFAIGESFVRLTEEIIKFDHTTWFNREAWKRSMSRVISSMMLGDFTYIMFGVYTTYKTKTGSMSFIAALCGYGILLTDIFIIEGAVLVLSNYAKITDKDIQYIFVAKSPDSLIVIPAALGISDTNGVWTTLYFFTNLITYLVWCVINITFMLQALYQRYTGMQNYYKYICPAICAAGFIIGLFLKAKEVYEIRFDLMQTVDLFCQHINLIVLTTMIVFIYGFKKLSDDIHFMTGKAPTYFWRITWIISPFMMLLSVPSNFLDITHPFFYFRIATVVIVFSPLFFFAIKFTLARIYHRDIMRLLKSDPQWGPKNDELRQARLNFQPRTQTKFMRYDLKCPHQCLLNHPTFDRIVEKEDFYDANILHVFHSPSKEAAAARPGSHSQDIQLIQPSDEVAIVHIQDDSNIIDTQT